MTEKYCFVIQPFDKGKFDSRYDDTIDPAIRNCGIEPYRVDRDISVDIPIHSIERKIAEASICLAEISSDNPNVWFELGYAIALKKEIILISEKRDKFPFDIQHRNIIIYDTNSLSSFKDLGKKIEDKISFILKKEMAITNFLTRTDTLTFDDLEPYQITVLAALMSEDINDNLVIEANLAIWHISTDYDVSELQICLALATLEQNGFISTKVVNGYEKWRGKENSNFRGFQLSSKAVNWLHKNVSSIKLQKRKE